MTKISHLESLWKRAWWELENGPIAVITVEPAGKASFVLGCIQTRLMGQYNGKWPISLVYMSKPLITVIAAIEALEWHTRHTWAWKLLAWLVPRGGQDHNDRLSYSPLSLSFTLVGLNASQGESIKHMRHEPERRLEISSHLMRVFTVFFHLLQRGTMLFIILWWRRRRRWYYCWSEKNVIWGCWTTSNYLR